VWLGLGATMMLGTFGRAALFDRALCEYQVKSNSGCALFVVCLLRDLLAAMHD
jgi:hypothetical protein